MLRQLFASHIWFLEGKGGGRLRTKSNSLRVIFTDAGLLTDIGNQICLNAFESIWNFSLRKGTALLIASSLIVQQKSAHNTGPISRQALN